MNSHHLEQVAVRLGRWWPARLRMIPDLCNDYIRDDTETKLAMPFFCQTDRYSCGAVAGRSVLKYLHPEADFPAFYRDANPRPLAGTSEGKLVRALRQHGVGVSIRRQLGFAYLRAAIERGCPIIVGVGHQYEDGDHWVVVYGVGQNPRRVFVCNWVRPGRSRQELSWAEFRALCTVPLVDPGSSATKRWGACQEDGLSRVRFPHASAPFCVRCPAAILPERPGFAWHGGADYSFEKHPDFSGSPLKSGRKLARNPENTACSPNVSRARDAAPGRTQAVPPETGRQRA